jgi:hypothetical protein
MTSQAALMVQQQCHKATTNQGKKGTHTESDIL